MPIALLLVSLVAGCGTATRPVGPGGGAAVAPRSTALLLRLDTSFDSPQWQALEAFGVGFYWTGNAKQALGPETDLVALGPGEPSPRTIVGLTQPRNPADLESVLPKQKPPLVSELIAQGASPDEAITQIGQVVEGLTTAPVLRDLSHRLGIELPITEGVCRVLAGESLGELVASLMGRRPRGE